MIQELKSGFRMDHSHIFNEEAISQSTLSSYEGAIFSAAKKMNLLRQRGILAGHFSKDGTAEKVLFPHLVNPNPEKIKRLKRMADLAKDRYATVISFGIGGSYLGNQVVFDLFCGPYWNHSSKEERKGFPKLYFAGNNLDSESILDLISTIDLEAKSRQLHHKDYRVLIVLISKSGQTVDTMAPFFIAQEAFNEQGIEFDVWAVTAPEDHENEKSETVLGQMAEENKWPRFEVPDGVGGRFSVFSEVGLVTAALTGVDIEEFIHGARDMELSCQSIHWQDNPALLNGALKWISATEYDKWIEVFMPYGNSLKSTAEWYVQLLAESLGKRKDLQGGLIEYGRTPVVAVGTTDMHAQTQLHQDGRRDKIIQFISIQDWRKDVKIPASVQRYEAFSKWNGIKLSAALEAARIANEKALASDQRWSSTIFLPTLNTYHVGGLLYFLILSVVYEGFMANVDPFDQPGVESYKRIMTPLLNELNNKNN